MAQRWITGATEVFEPTRQDVVESCKLYLGIKQILKEEDAQAITEHGICKGRGPYPLPCLAFTMLNDEGLAGICQLDLSSTITQLLIGYLADRPGFIGHIHIDTARNLIGMSHDFSATRLGGAGPTPKQTPTPSAITRGFIAAPVSTCRWRSARL